jgi:hypothetical protein
MHLIDCHPLNDEKRDAPILKNRQKLSLGCMVAMSASGLPDGIFSNQNPNFGVP